MDAHKREHHTMANIITLLRIAFLPFVYMALAAGTETGRWLGLALFILAALTDLIDGYIARTTGTASPLGAMLDLGADRLLTLATVAGLLVGGALGPFAMAAGVVMVARDLIVATFGEALGKGGRMAESKLERPKIALQFMGLGLLILPMSGFSSRAGAIALIGASVLATMTIVVYARHAMPTLTRAS
jgi:CDP-diacylglycerol--glycerol-3-phosphate 3-phosphatidyltransferase